MKDKQKICNELFRRYQKASKKSKGKLLDEYTQTLGYNRDYLAYLLSNWNKTRYAVLQGKGVKYVAKPAVKRHSGPKTGVKRGRPQKYTPAFARLLCLIWELFEYRCGKLLAPMFRLMIQFLKAEYDLTPEQCALLCEISPATIDRLLSKEKAKLRIRGKSLTRPGKLLKHQIPIRVFFSWDERKPGFFEIDTVSHCAQRTSGEFCVTLTLTDVYSGWIELRALRNRAHRWVKEHVAAIAGELPFPLKGIDSDNGGEFINEQLLTWCNEQQIQFTRSRPYRKNDNCFVEQKNGDMVRKMLGYDRFDTETEYNLLTEAYRLLCPLVNFWFPAIKLVSKKKLANGRYKKIYEKEPKTPCQRLLDSPELSPEAKAELERIRDSINPVQLKKAFDTVRDSLLLFNRGKGNTLATSA